MGRRVGPARLHKAESLLLRGRGWALLIGRCTAGVRVVLPGLAGMLGLRYRVFALWTGLAAMVWALAHVLLGYAAGAGWRQAYQLTSQAAVVLALAIVLALAVALLLRRPGRELTWLLGVRLVADRQLSARGRRRRRSRFVPSRRPAPPT